MINDYFIVGIKRMLVKLMEIGIETSDETILQFADDYFDKADKEFESNKKAFLNDIHRMAGR